VRLLYHKVRGIAILFWGLTLPGGYAIMTNIMKPYVRRKKNYCTPRENGWYGRQSSGVARHIKEDKVDGRREYRRVYKYLLKLYNGDVGLEAAII